MAAGIELPFIFARGDERRAAGTGDIQLEFRRMISKGERFEQAAGVQVIAPSATDELLEDGQTQLGLAWGLSSEVGKRTTLDVEFHYRKAVSSKFGTPKLHSVGVEAILTRAFTQRVAAYLDSDNYYEFSVHGYVNLLKAGVQVLLDRQKKWGLSPYVLFPSTQAARQVETRGAAGLDLTFEF